jgi:hypothetical protein
MLSYKMPLFRDKKQDTTAGFKVIYDPESFGLDDTWDQTGKTECVIIYYTCSKLCAKSL